MIFVNFIGKCYSHFLTSMTLDVSEKGVLAYIQGPPPKASLWDDKGGMKFRPLDKQANADLKITIV